MDFKSNHTRPLMPGFFIIAVLAASLSLALPVSSADFTTTTFRLPRDMIDDTHTTFAATGETTSLETFSVTTPTKLPIAISNVETLEANGNHRSIFAQGEKILISTTVQNTVTSNKDSLVSIQVLDPDVTVLPPTFVRLSLRAGQEFTFSPMVALPLDARIGTWTAETVVFSDFPSQGGVP
ncbi:MAG: hypothetical protein ACE5KO_02380, partial [Candidatus Bathyarchaeia archaeon]